MKAFTFLACTLVAVASLALPLQATVIFNDTFDSGTGAYYVDDTTAVTYTTTPPITNNSGVISWNGNSNVVVGRSFSSQTLSIGETLRITADYTMQSGTIVRFGLFNFSDTVITADNWMVDGSGTSAGYYAFFRDNSTAESDHRYESFGLGTTSELMANEAEDIGGTNTQYDFQTGTTYTLLYEVTLTSVGQVDTLASISQGASVVMSTAGTTTTNIVNSFNAFGFRTQSGSFSLDNVQLEVIPEPSSALLLGAFAGLALLRRRRC